MMEVSGKGDTPHCVRVSAAPGTAPESAAADLADASIEGAATDISTLSGSVVVDEHGLSVGVETVSSAPATTLPTDFGGPGWYTSNPTSVDNRAESLAGLVGRVNSVMTPSQDGTAGTVGGAGANYGIWSAHLVLAGTYSPAYIVGVLNWGRPCWF